MQGESIDHMIAPYALVMLRNGDKIAMLQRASDAKFMPNCYSLVGGSVERGETFRAAVAREAFEELGVVIAPDDLQFQHVFYRKGTDHELAAVIFACDSWQSEAYNKEPGKHTALAWFALDELPEKMIPAHRGALQLIAQGVHYSEQSADLVQ